MIIAYTYDADVHCSACAIARFGREPGHRWVREDALDSEGNPVGVVAQWDEWDPNGSYCGDCGDCIVEPLDGWA